MATRPKTTATSRGRTAPQRSRRSLFILTFIGLLIIVVIGGLAALGRNETNQRAQNSSLPVEVSQDPVPPSAEANGRAWGPKDAPIQVIEYADYECEACGMFASRYAADFTAAFANTGKVRYEIRNAPFHGEGSRNAAEAAYCATDQNAFWRMHDSLFVNQPQTEGVGAQAFSDARLNAIAAKLGLDTAAFEQCLSSDKYKQQVEADYQTTVQNKIDRTPTFVINGQPYPGVMSVEQLRQVFAQVAPDVKFDS